MSQFSVLALGLGMSFISVDASPVGAATTVVTQVSVGTNSACAVTSTHLAYCWGYGNRGQLGSGVVTNSGAIIRPQKVKLAGVASISVGSESACAVTTAAAVWCWGWNAEFELGRRTPAVSATPLQVQGLSPAKKVVVGENYACALLKSGSIKCWGDNGYGQLGNGTVLSKSSPSAVVGITTATDLMAGAGHTCATTQSSLFCWGTNGWEELWLLPSDSQPHPLPVVVSTSGWGTASTLAAGSALSQHSCVISVAKRVYCWGQNYNGQVRPEDPVTGNFDSTQFSFFDGIGTSATVRSVAIGQRQTCVVTTAKALYCQGANDVGQEGQPITGAPNAAGYVALSQPATSVAAGQDVACAILTSGAVACFGDNSSGLLGTATVTNSSTPLVVRIP
jgi:alpha-tubulin suppressor-like RCC1 family protein